MGYSKKSFMEFHDRDLEQHRHDQEQDYYDELDEQQVPTEWTFIKHSKK